MRILRHYVIPSAVIGLTLAGTVLISSALATTSRAPDEPEIDATPSMNVFRQPQTSSDRTAQGAVATEIARLTADDGPAGTAVGDAVPSTFRSLQSELGSTSALLYSFQTTRGHVCGGLSGAAAGCMRGFARQEPINWTIGQLPDRTVVFGFAPDGFSHVLVNGRRSSLVRNSFFAELPKEPVTSLVAVLADGSRQPVRLG